MRDMLFVSHANPEDNEFTLWLALQLTSQGYPIWCDMTKLLGGEDFWKDIEHAIRERTIKFIYVLSRTSNAKNGPLQELMIAQNVARDQSLEDFIIPLHIDDLPYRSINIQLARLNSIAFQQGWATGLKLLLDKLEKDSLAKSPSFTPDAVTSWWRYSVPEIWQIKKEDNMPKSKSKPLPISRSIDELVEFFDTHDMGEYWDQLPKAAFEINLKRRRHLVAIDEEIIPELNKIAKSKRLPSEKLINTWLREKIETSKRP